MHYLRMAKHGNHIALYSRARWVARSCSRRSFMMMQQRARLIYEAIYY